jgi:bifunctional non-homologous end joining protein LigD
MGLTQYKAKRDFTRTREPSGKVHAKRKERVLGFVVQKHAASHLHYDFRLEMEGVLKSWAVPKGFPITRGDRRLAIEVEDHPLEYGNFEGTIPKGNYGAGTVMVWDIGTYEVIGDAPVHAFQNGKIHLQLKGKKLKGEWTLVRTRSAGDAAKPQWLLLKTGADMAPLSSRAEDHSALTRRSLQQIAGARKKQEWESNRAATGSRLTKPTSARAPARLTAAGSKAPNRAVPAPEINLPRLPKAKPGFVEPMKALLVKELPKGSEWVYEVKFDGVRALAVKMKDSRELISRNGNALTAKYPQISEALGALPAAEVVLDGEVVAVDSQGRSSFQLLQSYHTAGTKKPALFYYVFDLLNLEGKDLTGLPLWQRKAMAEALLANLSPVVRFSSSIQANSARLMREMQARGLEGLIAKRKDSRYEVGRRSGAWVKFKWNNEQEFVIGGYTAPQGGRSHFGALLVGYYEHDKLLFAAKVGTGFNQRLLADLHARFQKLVRRDCPFANLPETLAGSSPGLTAAKMKHCTWLEPKLVCQIRFAEWTRDHHLRQPAFLGLREDKDPKEVVRERAK